MRLNHACTHLDLLEELVPSHLRHPVISDDHAHIGLLQVATQQQDVITSSSNVQKRGDLKQNEQ
jgi:hypothetical protein